MSVIERHNTTEKSVPVDLGLDDALPIPAIEKAIRRLPAQRNIILRPPKLPLPPLNPAGATELDRLLAPDLETIASCDTLDLAFAVSELAARLEEPVTAAGSSGAEQGFEVLSEMAKMYEHLIVLQNDQEV